MSLQSYESGIKEIPYSNDSVYRKLADLRNLELIKEAMSNPAALEAMGKQLSEDKIAQAKSQLESMRFDEDSLSFNLPPAGEMTLRIIEREEPKCIKMQADKSPFPITLWIQLLPMSGGGCKMKLTLKAELNMMMKMMVGKHLQKGVDQIAEMLAKIPYGV